MGAPLPLAFLSAGSLYTLIPSGDLASRTPAINPAGTAWEMRDLSNASLLTTGTLATSRLSVGTGANQVADGATAAYVNAANSFTTGQSIAGSDTVLPLNVRANTTATGLLPVGLVLSQSSSLTPVAGFGIRQAFRLKSSTTVDRDAGYIDSLWTSTADATRTSALAFSVSNLGTIGEAVRLIGNGNLGLGITLPTSSLHIARISATAGITLERTTTSTGKTTLNNAGNGIFTLTADSDVNIAASTTGLFTIAATDGQMTARRNTVLTNTLATVLKLTHNTTGIAAANLGSQIEFQVNTDSALRPAGQIGFLWTAVADATRTSAAVISAANNGVVAERARFDAGLGVAGNTGLMLFDVNANTMRRVSVGANDSGGAGFKVLRITNA